MNLFMCYPVTILRSYIAFDRSSIIYRRGPAELSLYALDGCTV
jgi:hypothetical protein